MKKIGYRALAISAALLLPFGAQRNLTCAASSEKIGYHDEQDDSIVEVNFDDLPEIDFNSLNQQNVPTNFATPSLSNNIATFSLLPQYFVFDDFRLKAGYQYDLLYEIAYSKGPYFYLRFKPDRTCNMCVGLVRSSDLSVFGTKMISVTANKTHKIKFTLARGSRVYATIFNNTPYTMNFSNVSIEHYVC